MRFLKKYNLGQNSLNFSNYYDEPLGIKLINKFIYDSIITIFDNTFKDCLNVKLKDIEFNYIDGEFKDECIFLIFDYMDDSYSNYIEILQPLIRNLDSSILEFIDTNLSLYLNGNYLNNYIKLPNPKELSSIDNVHIHTISDLENLYKWVIPFSNKVLFKTVERKDNIINSVNFYYKVTNNLQLDIYLYNYCYNITTPSLYKEHLVNESLEFFNEHKSLILNTLKENLFHYSITDFKNNICLLNGKRQFEIIHYISNK